MINRLCTLALVLCLVFPFSVQAQSSSLSLTEIKNTYDSLQSLQARFTQIIGSDFAGDSTRLEGTVLLSGDKYRVETPDQTVVSNAQTTWIYTPSDSQVVVNSTEKNASTVTPETFLTASSEQYRIEARENTTRESTPHTLLEIVASDSTARFRSAQLWVRSADQIVTRMLANDRNGSTLDLRLRDIELNPTLDENPFTFTPPDNIEVIDLRASE